MQIREFLEKYVEGYLFKDLSNMAAIFPRKGETHGAAGYPMVSATLAGMELLGFLISHSQFATKKGETYFSHYWDNVLVKAFPEYGRTTGLSHVLRALARDGLAHNFLTKGGIEIVKGQASGHLDIDTRSLYLRINCTRLWEDFRDSYLRFVKPIVFSGLPLLLGTDQVTGQTMETQLERLVNAYSRDAATAFGKLGPGFARIVSGSTMGSSAPTPNTVIVTTGSRGPTF